MKKEMLLAVAAMPVLAWTAPVVTDVEMIQTPDREVTINYTLSGEAAVVTFDIVTNALENGGASVGGRNLWYPSGDVNRLIGRNHDFATPLKCSIKWNPSRTPLAECGFVATDGSVKAVVKAWSTNCPPEYMSVRLGGLASTYRADAEPITRFYADKDFVPGGVTDNADYKSSWLLMRKIPAAGIEWRMGSPSTESGRSAADEIPRLVKLSADYYIGVFKVTKQQYYAATNVSSSAETVADPHTPAVAMKWNSVRGTSNGSTTDVEPASGSFLASLRQATGVAFDLPTEAQWEYACRAGTSGSNYGAGDVYAIAWAGGKSAVTDVGTLLPNNWGLYDMIGNTYEIVLDYYANGDALYATFGGKGYADPVENPAVLNATSTGAKRVRRGACYDEWSSSCRSARRRDYGVGDAYVGVGMRLACPAIVR